MSTIVVLTCQGCNTPFEVDYSPQLDAFAFPELEQSVIAGTLNIYACPQCGQKSQQKLPYVYWREDWVAVVLEMGSRNSAEEAIRQTNHLLKITRPNRDNLPSQVRVLGSWNDLTSILQNPQGRAYTQQLADLAVRNWHEEISILESVADAFLKAEMPEYAFWMFAFMIEFIPDFYFDSYVREVLEITALEAGDRLLPMTEEKRTVAEHLEEIEQLLRSQAPMIDRLENYDLIWYMPTPPDFNGIMELTTSIEEMSISDFEQAQARLLTTFLIYEAKRFLPEEDEEIEAFLPIITQLFLLSWEKISRKEQLELEKLWRQLAGSSLINDSQLRLKDGMERMMSEQKTAEQWRDEGHLLRDLQRHEEALVVYEQAIRLSPNDVISYTSKGNTLGRLQRYEEALAAYEQAIRADPSYILAYYNQGYILQLCQRYEEALAAYEQAILLDPNNACAYISKGDTLSDLQRYEEALAAYEQAILLAPSDAITYTSKGNTLGGLQRYEEALAAYEQAISYTSKGNTLGRLQRYEEALAAYEQAIRADPSYALAYYNQGYILQLCQRYEEALAACEQAILLDPNNASAYASKGDTLSDLQRYEEALAAYEQAIRADPSYILAYYNQGLTFGTLERYEEALIAFEQAILLDPNNASAYASKGDTLSDLQRYEEALAAYEQTVRLDSKDFAAVAMKGFTLWTLDRREEALATFEEAIRLAPSDASLYHAKGTILEELGRSQEAQQFYALAKQLGYS